MNWRSSRANSGFDKLILIGADIDKDAFYCPVFDAKGHLVMRKQIKQLALVATFKKPTFYVIGMEACLSALL